jgi:hypothetical protein
MFRMESSYGVWATGFELRLMSVPPVSTREKRSEPAPKAENLEFRRTGVLPPRQTSQERYENRVFLYIFLGLLGLFLLALALIVALRS